MKVHIIKKIIVSLLVCYLAVGMTPGSIRASACGTPQSPLVITAGIMPVGIHAQEAVASVGRVYIHCYSEFTPQDETYLSYPEIFGLEDREYQEKINTFIQEMAWDDMFGSLISSYKSWYDNQQFWGIQKGQNELGEVRFNEDIISRRYGKSCHLYGRILSMDYSGTTSSDGVFACDGDWERTRGWPFYKVLNFDVEKGEEVLLNEILDLNDEFFRILEELDITEYTDLRNTPEYNGSRNIEIYYEFVDAMKDEGERRAFVNGEQSYYKWYVDEQGNLKIYDDSEDGLPGFTVPISLFYTLLRSEYSEYVGELPGYDFSVPSETGDATVSPSASQGTAWGEPVIERKSYEYGEDVKLDYLQLSGMADPVLQGKANDFILDVVIGAVADDLGYAYMNNDYYEREAKEKESLVYVESELPDYYLNGPLLSFTHMQKTTRKAYVAKDGTRKGEICKEPCLQAYNYDIVRGKEVTFGDVFEADDEFFEIIFEWRKENPEAGQRDDDIAYNRSSSIESYFIQDMEYYKYYDTGREEFINGEVKYYHWFIDHDEEGNNLCIYRYYALDDEDQCFKIPMSCLKDKLKPEYRDCYYLGEE